jgi:hypothetical protein
MSYDKFAPPPYPVQANPPYAFQANPTYVVQANLPYAVPVVTNYGMQTGFNIVLIKDYLVWSLINLFCGWGIGGFIPLIFSILCRNYKSVNDYSGAQSMSTIALIFNIIVTVAGTIGWIIFIIIMAIYIAAINSLP